MPKSKSVTKCIMRNVKNKKEDENRKKVLKQMDHDAAEPRAPAASAAKVRRKLKKKKGFASKEEEEEIESSSKDYAPCKKTAAMKRQLEQHQREVSSPKKTTKRTDEEQAIRNSSGDVKTVANRRDMTVVSALDIEADYVPFSRLPGYNKEHDTQVRTLLVNLAKASREKALPAVSTLKLEGNYNRKGKHHTPVFKNVGSDIIKVCLSQPVWALVHRRDLKRGFDEWFENSDNLIQLLNNGDADNINAALKTAVTKQINDAVRERVYFEILGDVCNDLFKTIILPNKKFDKNFVTVAINNTNPTVRSLSIPKYFKALNENVWQKISDSMDILLTGVGGGDHSAISQLEACAENIINRAKSRPVEATIKKAVEQANQAHKLSTGAFIPTTNKKQLPLQVGQLQGNPFFNPGYYDPYYHYYQQQSHPPPLAHNYYYGPGGAPPAVTQMQPSSHPHFFYPYGQYQHPPPPPPPPPQPTKTCDAASVPTTADAPAPPTASIVATAPTPQAPSLITSSLKNIQLPSPRELPKTPSFSPVSSPIHRQSFNYPSPQNTYSSVLPPIRPPRTPGRDLNLENREQSIEKSSEEEIPDFTNLPAMSQDYYYLNHEFDEDF